MPPHRSSHVESRAEIERRTIGRSVAPRSSRPGPGRAAQNGCTARDRTARRAPGSAVVPSARATRSRPCRRRARPRTHRPAAGASPPAGRPEQPIHRWIRTVPVAARLRPRRAARRHPLPHPDPADRLHRTVRCRAGQDRPRPAAGTWWWTAGHATTADEERDAAIGRSGRPDMSGPIALHGGGEFLPGDEPFLAALLDLAARRVRGDRPIRVTVVPTATARGRPDPARRQRRRRIPTRSGRGRPRHTGRCCRGGR